VLLEAMAQRPRDQTIADALQGFVKRGLGR
jgi:hypothetical protein